MNAKQQELVINQLTKKDTGTLYNNMQEFATRVALCEAENKTASATMASVNACLVANELNRRGIKAHAQFAIAAERLARIARNQEARYGYSRFMDVVLRLHSLANGCYSEVEPLLDDVGQTNCERRSQLEEHTVDIPKPTKAQHEAYKAYTKAVKALCDVVGKPTQPEMEAFQEVCEEMTPKELADFLPGAIAAFIFEGRKTLFEDQWPVSKFE